MNNQAQSNFGQRNLQTQVNSPGRSFQSITNFSGNRNPLNPSKIPSRSTLGNTFQPNSNSNGHSNSSVASRNLSYPMVPQSSNKSPSGQPQGAPRQLSDAPPSNAAVSRDPQSLNFPRNAPPVPSHGNPMSFGNNSSHNNPLPHCSHPPPTSKDNEISQLETSLAMANAELEEMKKQSERTLNLKNEEVAALHSLLSEEMNAIKAKLLEKEAKEKEHLKQLEKLEVQLKFKENEISETERQLETMKTVKATKTLPPSPSLSPKDATPTGKKRPNPSASHNSTSDPNAKKAKRDISVLEKENEQLRKNANTLKDRLKAVKRALNGECPDREREVQLREELTQVFHNEIFQLRNVLEGKNPSAMELKKVEEKLKETLNALEWERKQNKALKEELEANRQNIIAILERNKELEKDILTAKKEEEKLSNEYKKLEALQKEQEGDLVQMANELLAMKNAKESLEKETEILKEQNKEMERKVKNGEGKNGKVEEVESLKELNDKLQIQIAELIAEQERLEEAERKREEESRLNLLELYRKNLSLEAQLGIAPSSPTQTQNQRLEFPSTASQMIYDPPSAAKSSNNSTQQTEQPAEPSPKSSSVVD